MSKVFLSILIILIQFSASAQITMINPGMEDTPSDATVPQGWSPCAWLTTPDILPGYWGVYTEPYEGDTYAGIITRENGSFESFGQRLSEPLQKKICYQMSFQLAYSKVYAGYGLPIKLRVSISDELCGETEVVYVSPLISHEDWRTYTFTFTPKENAHYIMLEAFHKDGSFSYKGNILIDGISAIFPCLKA